MIISVTGTPGAGKSTFSKELSKKLGYTLVDINDFLDSEDKLLVLEYDEERETKIVDEERVVKKVEDYLRNEGFEDVVIDSHLSHYMSDKFVDVCVVMVCDISILTERLADRGYNELKLKENLDAEIFEEIKTESLERHKNVIVVDSTKGYKINEIIKKIKLIEKKKNKIT